MTPPLRFARTLAHLVARRGGPTIFATCASALLGGLAFITARFIHANAAGTLVFAGSMALLFFGYFLVFVNLRVLGYFPRQAERRFERVMGPVGALLFGGISLATAPTTVATVIVVVGTVVMAVHLGLRGKRDLSEPLRWAVTYPRSPADARAMLDLARSMRGQELPPRERFLVELNTANALLNLAQSEDTYRRLHEAYEILLALTTSPMFSEPQFRVSLADTLAQVASNLHGLGDDLQIYEQAALLLDRALAEGGLTPHTEFRRLLNRADLEFARAGVALPTPPDPARTRALHNAIEYLRDAVLLAPRHRRTDLYTQMAIYLAVLADWSDDQEWLAQATEQARLGLQAIRPVNRERRPEVQMLLADLLVQRFSAADTPAPADLVEADRLARAARSSHDPEVRAYGWLVHIGVLRRRRVVDLGSVDIQTEAFGARQGTMAAPLYSRARLRLAGMLALWAAEEEVPDTAAWAYCDALATARRLSATGLIRRQQQAAQYEVRGFAAEAVHWLLKCGRPNGAVSVLESSRALVLSSAMNRERLIRRLEKVDPLLARRCAELSVKLAKTDPSGSQDAGPSQLWAGLSDRRAVRAVHDEWRELAEWLGRWPEFRSLLDQPSYGDVADAARHQPLVYLAAANQRGYALIVESRGHPRVLELPGLTRWLAADMAHKLRAESGGLDDPLYARTHWRAALSDILLSLHTAVMGPLVRQLGLTGPVTLIPVGDLALLPLHAAADDPTNTAITWSYAPSAQVLVRAADAARERGPVSPGGVLLVTASGPAERELHYTTAVAPSLKHYGATVTALADNAARRDAVLAALEGHHAYHFACHGAADSTDPLNSHLQLTDGRLTMRDLLDRRLPARLAVLAACESGVPYAQLPDEAVALPGALLEAGVPGVISTLWPVEELPTLLLTTRFYELWLSRRSPPAVALHKAQQWLCAGTAAQFAAYLHDSTDGAIRWPQIYTGRARHARIYAHPDYWAAFTYTGM
jgi:hypothetical protein